MRYAFILVAVSFSSVDAQMSIDFDNSTHSLFCRPNTIGFFGATAEDSVRYDKCGSMHGSLFSMDKYVFPTLAGLVTSIPDGINPCDFSTYLTTSEVSGNIGIVFEVYSLVCDNFAGQKMSLLGYQKNYVSKMEDNYKWLADKGAQGFVTSSLSTGTFPYSLHITFRGQLQEPLVNYMTFSDASVVTIVMVTLGVPMSARMNPTGFAGYEEDYPTTIFAGSVGYRLTFYLIALPLTILLIAYASRTAYRLLKSWKSFMFMALVLEGIVANTFRLARICVTVPYSFVGFHPFVLNFFEGFPMVISNLASILAACLFLQLKLRLPSTIHNCFTFVLATTLTVLSIVYTMANANIFQSFDSLEDINPTFKRLEEDAETFLLWVNIVIGIMFAVASCMMIHSVMNAAKMTSGQSLKSLIKWILLQAICSLLIALSSYYMLAPEHHLKEIAKDGDVFGSDMPRVDRKSVV